MSVCEGNDLRVRVHVWCLGQGEALLRTEGIASLAEGNEVVCLWKVLGALVSFGARLA